MGNVSESLEIMVNSESKIVNWRIGGEKGKIITNHNIFLVHADTDADLCITLRVYDNCTIK